MRPDEGVNAMIPRLCGAEYLSRLQDSRHSEDGNTGVNRLEH